MPQDGCDAAAYRRQAHAARCSIGKDGRQRGRRGGRGAKRPGLAGQARAVARRRDVREHRPRGGARPLFGMGRVARHRAVGPPRGGAPGHRVRRPRDPGHAHRLRQVHGGAGHVLHRHLHRPARVLHGPHQGAGEREVLRPCGALWPRERGHDHRRRHA